MLDSIRTQIDVISALSSGALGLIFLTWGRVMGILDDADMSQFRAPAFLTLPAFLLIIAVVLGYFAGAQTTGYYTEIAMGINSSDGSKIRDARMFYFDGYDAAFHWMMMVQLLSSIAGILMIGFWFSWNVLFRKRRNYDDTKTFITNTDDS